jgi:hypothetical protein
MVVVLAGILVLVLGNFPVFVTLLTCALLIFLYRSPVSEVTLTIVLAAILGAIYRQLAYSVTVISVGVIAAILGVLLSHQEYTSGMAKGFSPLRGLISSVFVLAIGASLALVDTGVLLVGLIVIIAGFALAVYGIWKLRQTKDVGLRGYDPVMTVTLVILFSSILALVLRVIPVFAFLFSSSLVLFLYRRPMLLIAFVFIEAIFLSGLLINAIYPLGIIVLGAFAIAIGMITKRIESDRIARASRAKKI